MRTELYTARDRLKASWSGKITLNEREEHRREALYQRGRPRARGHPRRLQHPQRLLHLEGAVSLVSDLLPLLDFGGQLEADFGLRPFTAQVRMEQYDRSIGLGATMTGTRAVVDITPVPAVEQLTDELAMFYGAGELLADSTGESA
jgi:hypothetical protein